MSVVRESITTGPRVPISCQSYQEMPRSARRPWKRYSVLWTVIFRKRRSLSALSLIQTSSSVKQQLSGLWPWTSRRLKPRTKYSVLFLSLQPIQALEHPKFKELINVASCATNGIKIPGQKATQGEIKCMFKDHLVRLKAQLNVSTLLGSHSVSHHFPESNCPRRSQPNM